MKYQLRSERKGLRLLVVIDVKRRTLVKRRRKNQKMDRRSDETEHKQEKRRNRMLRQNQTLIIHSQSPRVTNSLVRSKKS